MQYMRNFRFDETLFRLRKSSKGARVTIALIALAYVACVVTWVLIGRVPVYVTVEGVIAPREDAQTLISQVSGEVVQSRLRKGKRVEKGEVLVTLDSTAVELERQSAEAELEALEQLENASLARMSQIKRELGEVARTEQADKRVIRRELADKRAVAQESSRRLRELEQLRQAGTTTEYEVEQAQLRAASDKLMADAWSERLHGAAMPTEASRVVRREIAGLEKQLVEIRGKRVELQVQLEVVKEQMRDYVIVAPTSGVLVEGSSLAPGTRITAGAEIALIETDSPLVVRGTASAAKAGKVARGQSARLELNSFSRARFGYIICEVGMVVRSAEQSDLRIDFEILESGSRGYRPKVGDRGTVNVEVERATPFQLLLDRI